MEFILSRFRTFLEMHKIFYMVEQTFDGNVFVDMVIDEPKLRQILLSEQHNTLDYETAHKTLSALDHYDNSEYIKPICEVPSGRGANCVRIVCDKTYASKINKASHIIMNYHSEHFDPKKV